MQKISFAQQFYFSASFPFVLYLPLFTSSKEIKTREKRKNTRKFLYYQLCTFTIPRGLTVRIAGFHPPSRPGFDFRRGNCFPHYSFQKTKILLLKKNLTATLMFIDPTWSNGQDSWLSPSRPGFNSRCGKYFRCLSFPKTSAKMQITCLTVARSLVLAKFMFYAFT